MAAKKALQADAPRAFVLGNYVQACCWHLARLPQPGETLAARALQVEPGGKGLNVAVALRRLGVAVDTLIGCGRDAAGDALLALLRSEGISAAHVHRFDAPSGCGAGLVGADGRNLIAVHAGANALLRAAHLRSAQAALAGAQLVYGQLETALPPVQAAFAWAHAAGVPTVLNPSPWRALPAALRRCTHTLIVNETEVLHLLGLRSALPAEPGQAAARLAAQLPALAARWPALRRLVVTLGARGSLGWLMAPRGPSGSAEWGAAANGVPPGPAPRGVGAIKCHPTRQRRLS